MAGAKYCLSGRPFTFSSMYQVQRLWIAVRLATAHGQYQRAAMLFGLAEQIHSRIGHVYAEPVRLLVNEALTKVYQALGAEHFDEAIAAGQQLSLEDALMSLLAPDQRIS